MDPLRSTTPARRARALLAGAVVCAHGREVAFGFTSLDDLTLVVDDQPFLTSAGALSRAFGRTYFHVVDAAHAYYRPVVTASYALDARFFEAGPSGYHATNVILHLLSTWLVHALLTRARLRNDVALVAALGFGVHPALVQTVAWVPGRNDSLLTAFALLAVLTHARVRSASSSSEAIAWRALHVASFALAMFTKETAIVVPLVCLAWSHLVEKHDARTRPGHDALPTWIAWASVVGAFAVARHRVLSAALGEPAVVDWDAPFRHVSVLASSAGKILFPLNLSPIATLEDTPAWPGMSAVIALAMLVVFARRFASVRMRVIAFGATLYVLALLPVLFTPGVLVLENRLYLPAVGLLFVIAELADKARIERTAGLAFACATVLAMAALTLGYASAYRDSLSFGKAAVAGAPRSSLAHLTLGQARQLRGELDAALNEYSSALAIDPSEPIVHNNVAVVHMRRHDWPRAKLELEAELRVNPGYRVANDNLAIVERHLAAESPR